jgi:hypothetical protein
MAGRVWVLRVAVLAFSGDDKSASPTERLEPDIAWERRESNLVAPLDRSFYATVRKHGRTVTGSTTYLRSDTGTAI